MTQIIDGKKISQEIKDELREQVAEQKKLGKEAVLAVIQVGTDPASSVYVNNKRKPAPISASVPCPMNCLRRRRRKNFLRLWRS